MYARLWLVLGVWLLVAAGAAAKERTWTDVDGRTMRGEFLRELGDEVALLVDGKLVTIPLARLSPRDQQAVRDLAAGKELADEPPPTPAPSSPAPAPSSEPAPAASSVPATPAPAANDDSVVDVTPVPAATPPAVVPEPQRNETQRSERPPPPPSLTGRRPKAPASRTWTDTQGRQVSGKFVRVFNGKVMISRPGGIVPVGFYDLSDGDQEYVKQVLTERGEQSLIPPKPVPQGVEGLAGGTTPMGAASSIPAGAIEIATSFPETTTPMSPVPDSVDISAGAGSIDYGAGPPPPINYGPEMNSGSSYDPGSVEIMPSMPGPPTYDPRGVPTMPTVPQYGTSSSPLDIGAERVGICSGCNREVRGVDTYMNKCPHCGTRWSYNEFNDGERAGQLADRLGGAAIAAVAAVVVAVVMLAGVIGIVMAIAKASRGGQQYKHPRYGPPRY
ncbi:MAG: hypothetical protein MUF06_10460 [Pirellulaceae bacterium]|nr:hypothetical protein [Pirellulaceae bacterium]